MRRLTSGFVLLAIAAQLAWAGTDQATFRTTTRTVSVPVTVHDQRGRLATGLTEEDFDLFEDGRRVPITQFTGDPQPLTLVLMFDTSNSASPNIASVRRAALAAVDGLGTADRARIGTFGAEIAVSPHLTGDRGVLARIIREEIWPSYTSRVWEATWHALNTLAGDTGSRRTLILLTDGSDTSPKGSAATNRSAQDVHERARRDQWSIYAVVPHRAVGRDLRSLVDDTGGRIIEGTRGDTLPLVFTNLMTELKEQYLLGFNTTTSDGRVHAIEVRPRDGDLRVTARRSYQAGVQ